MFKITCSFKRTTLNWYKNIPRLNHFESQHHQSRHHDTYLPRNIHKNPTILYYMFQPWNQSCLPLGSMMLHQNCLHSHLILIHSLNTVLTRYQVCLTQHNELNHGKNGNFGTMPHCLPQRLKSTFFEIFWAERPRE